MDMQQAIATLNKYREEFAEAPTLRTWTPRESDAKYYGRSIAKETEKRNAAYRKEYDSEVAEHNAFLANLQKVKSIHPVLLSFFVTSLEGWVEGIRNRRAALQNAMYAFQTRWDRDYRFIAQPSNPADKPWEARINPFRDKCDLRYRCWHRTEKNSWGKVVTEGHLREGLTGIYSQYLHAFAPTTAEQVEFFRDLEQYEEHYDELRNSRTPADIFFMGITRFADIARQIEKVLGGAVDHVEQDANWGYGGHFNGIVGHEGKRASFKSFLAGGWNIQREHVRFRITLLNH